MDDTDFIRTEQLKTHIAQNIPVILQQFYNVPAIPPGILQRYCIIAGMQHKK